jgi:hypothetical protein
MTSRTDRATLIDRDSRRSDRDTPHAEVAQVWPRDGMIRVNGSIFVPQGEIKGPASGHAVLVLRLRGGGGRELRCPATVHGRRFECVADVERIPAPRRRRRDEVWDLYLDVGTERMRVGRHLDDIVGKKKIMTFPAQRGAGGAASVRPYYTVRDNLSVRCRR